MNPSLQNPDREREQARSPHVNDHHTVAIAEGEASWCAILESPRSQEEIGWFQHYRVLRKLGEGGMGIVFLAEDSHLKRPVALKVMHPRMAENAVGRQRFLREAQAMAAIHHEHVVVVYQVGLAKKEDARQDLPFLAMQYLEGETLQERLARDKRLPPVEVARIGREIAEGLAAAHAKGLIHRDIKLSNIWLAAPRGSVKILDFGLARLIDNHAPISHSGQIIGTPHFMSPEQARGDPIDPRADLFSLGCVLYSMGSGSLPFDGSGPMAILTRLAVDEPVPLQERVPDMPADLARLAHGLMAKRPQDRPASAAVVAQALAQIEKPCERMGMPTPAESTLDQPQSRLEGDETLADSRTRELSKPDPAPSASPPIPPAGKRHGIERRYFLAGTGAAIAAGAGWYLLHSLRQQKQANGPVSPSNELPFPRGEPILVGVLCSLSGTWRDRDTPVMQMTQTAIDETNEKGGLLGRPVQAIVRDGASNERTFAHEAERLVTEDGVKVLVGGGTSACRKAVKEIVERHRRLLIYPARHEGLESSGHIIYAGATPNQFVLPAIDVTLARNPGAKLFIVGLDNLFSHALHAIVRLSILTKKTEIVGEEYLPSSDGKPKEIVDKIKAAAPTIILNTIQGQRNHAFFVALRAGGVLAHKTPTLSFDLDEQILHALPPRLVAGDFVAASYFATVPGARNQHFLDRYQARWGDAYPVTDSMQAVYLGLRLWAQAVEKAPDLDADAVRAAMHDQRIDAPEGDEVRIDPDHLHAWRYFRLGQIMLDGAIRILRTSDKPLPPKPFPASRSQEEWEQFLTEKHQQWGNHWSPPRE